jgi:hypothetical protein
LTREISCPKTGSGAKNLSLDELDGFMVIKFCCTKLKKRWNGFLEKIHTYSKNILDNSGF